MQSRLLEGRFGLVMNSVLAHPFYLFIHAGHPAPFGAVTHCDTNMKHCLDERSGHAFVQSSARQDALAVQQYAFVDGIAQKVAFVDKSVRKITFPQIVNEIWWIFFGQFVH